jgi:hypothetical protein
MAKGSVRLSISSETAVWYSTGLFAVPLRWVLVRDPQGEFKTQALLCTDVNADPEKILSWFVMRWRLEVTFQEVRRHLGFETQRQWSELAIQRTTPALLEVFSVLTLFAHGRRRQEVDVFRQARQAAWYQKTHPAFAEALALVRRVVCKGDFSRVTCGHGDSKSPKVFMERLTDALCYAA